MDKIKVADYEAVLATVAKYTESCKEGKSDIMKPAFTANALMYGYLNGEYYHGSIEALYGAVDAFGPAPDTLARVDVLNIEVPPLLFALPWKTGMACPLLISTV